MYRPMLDTMLLGIQNVKVDIKSERQSDKQSDKQPNNRKLGLTVNINTHGAKKLETANRENVWVFNLSIEIGFEDMTSEDVTEIGGGSFEFDAIFSLDNDHGLGENYWKEKDVESEVVSMIFCAKRESMSNILIQSGYPRLALPYNINHRREP